MSDYRGGFTLNQQLSGDFWDVLDAFTLIIGRIELLFLMIIIVSSILILIIKTFFGRRLRCSPIRKPPFHPLFR